MTKISPPASQSAAALAKLRRQYDQRPRWRRWLGSFEIRSAWESSLLVKPHGEDPTGEALWDQQWRRTIQVLDGVVILIGMALLGSRWLGGH
jgi:hypothetical protein